MALSYIRYRVTNTTTRANMIIHYIGLELAGLMRSWALVTMVMAPATELLVTPSTMVIAIAPAKAFTEAAIPPVLSHSNYCPCLALTLFCLFFWRQRQTELFHPHCVTSYRAGWAETWDCFLITSFLALNAAKLSLMASVIFSVCQHQIAELPLHHICHWFRASVGKVPLPSLFVLSI